MGSEIAVVGVDGAGCLAGAPLGHAGVAIDAGEIGAARGEILFETKPGLEQAAIVVEGLGLLDVSDGFVDAILLLLQQGEVQP